MAARFWVGGTGNWDASDTTHWSASSGGAGGASVPGASDTVTLDGSSGGGTVTVTATVSVTSITAGAFTGTLDTNGQSITTSGTISITGTGVRTVTLGASAISCSLWNAGTTTNLTFNAGTSTITITGSNNSFVGGGLTYGTLVWSSAGTAIITGANTFANLTRNGTATKTDVFQLGASQTITGTLTLAGNSSINRLLIQSDTRGTARTLTAAAVSASNVDFQDITGAGASSWNLTAISGLSGDCGGNSGITFTTAATQYWQHGASASYNWSDATRWFLATNGGGGAGRVPLPQDGPARFDVNSFAAGSKIVVQDMPRIPGADWTGVTNTPTFRPTTAASFFGSIKVVSGMTLTASTAAYTYEGRGASTITSGGKAWGKPFIIDCVVGSLTMQDAFSITAQQLTLTSGTFDSNGYTLTASFFVTTGSATRTLSLGASLWLLDGGIGNPWSVSSATGLTLNAGTSTIQLTGTLTAARSFVGAGLTYYNLENATAGAFALQFTGSNTFNNIHVEASGAARTLLFTAGTTTTVASFTRDAGTNVITIGSITAASHTLTKTGGGYNSLDYLSISRSTATPGSTWYAGSHSTDGGNNSGWIFGPAPLTSSATAASASWVAPAASAGLRHTAPATAASSSWGTPAAIAQTRYTVDASPSFGSWAGPAGTAQTRYRPTATEAFSAWIAPDATAQTGLVAPATEAGSAWVAPDATAALNRRWREIEIPVSAETSLDIEVSV